MVFPTPPKTGSDDKMEEVVARLNDGDDGGDNVLDSLPNEILIHICSYLEARFVLEVVSQISPRLQQLISDDSLWKLRTKKRYHHQFPPVDPTVQLK